VKHLLVTNDYPPKIGGIQSLLWEWWRRLPPDRFAVLTSPYATAWAWARQGGTGLSASTIRLSPTLLAELPWPAGALDTAVAALGRGDVVGCGQAVDAAYGSTDAERFEWWCDRIDAAVRRSTGKP